MPDDCLHRWLNLTEPMAAFAICELKESSSSGSSSLMLTPPATLRCGVIANFTSGVTLVRLR